MNDFDQSVARLIEVLRVQAERQRLIDKGWINADGTPIVWIPRARVVHRSWRARLRAWWAAR